MGIGGLIGFGITVFASKDYDRWHNQPKTKNEFMESLDIPTELQDIEYDDFLANL